MGYGVQVTRDRVLGVEALALQPVHSNGGVDALFFSRANRVGGRGRARYDLLKSRTITAELRAAAWPLNDPLDGLFSVSLGCGHVHHGRKGIRLPVRGQLRSRRACCGLLVVVVFVARADLTSDLGDLFTLGRLVADTDEAKVPVPHGPRGPRDECDCLDEGRHRRLQRWWLWWSEN